MTTRRVTIKDVAKRAGVTHTTVSRVIHDDARISPETKSRVRAALDDMKYKPNLVARGLVRNRAQSIALITPALTPQVLPIVRSVAECCEAREYAMMLFPTDMLVEEGKSFATVADNWLVDGVLIYNLLHHEKVPTEIEALQNENLPFVFINKFLNQQTVNAVGVDNESSLDLAVDHLVKLGHQRIGFLKGDLSSNDGMEMFRAFKKSLEKHDLTYDDSISGIAHWNDEEAYEVTKAILKQPKPPTAIVSSDDLMALGAMRAALDAGLTIPKDLSVIGFGDLEAGRLLRPDLTTVKPSLKDVGAMATQLLMNMLKHGDRDGARHTPEQIRIDSRLLVRGSTGPAPKKK